MILPDSARDVLLSGALAHLVTVNPDGSPHVSCVWVGLDEHEDLAPTAEAEAGIGSTAARVRSDVPAADALCAKHAAEDLRLAFVRHDRQTHHSHGGSVASRRLPFDLSLDL